MKILIRRGSDVDTYVDASTPKLEAQAYLYLFKEMDSELCYSDVEPGDCHFALYKRANEGDAAAAKALIQMRKVLEYEEVYSQDVIDPFHAPETEDEE